MSEKATNLVALVILDGWGFSDNKTWNAIYAADPKTFNALWADYPHALLQASGRAAGLPEGAVGNSEVGHLTIGTGRVIDQPRTHIDDLIANGSFFHNPILTNALEKAHAGNGRVHLIGLISDGGIHGHIAHLQALIQMAARYKIPQVFIQAIVDGRDAPPHSASTYLQALAGTCSEYKTGTISSLAGRFYAMDRDENWDRTLEYYRMLLGQNQPDLQPWKNILTNAYAAGLSDEYIPPTLLDKNAAIKDGDTCILFNIRPDRMRQLTSLLSNKQLPARTKPNPENGLPVLHITLASFVRYSTCFDNPVLLEKELVTQTLLDILDAHKIQTFTIAESEKYAHVTYFFGGGREIQRPHETRILVPSPQTDRCDKIPCMSAPAITQAVLDSLEQAPCDFYLVNYANSDMVGHTGNFEATVKAIQCLDTQLARLFKAIVQEREGTLLITADHGNAEEKWDVLHHQVKTSHTTNPVPFIAVSNNASGNKISCEKLHELSQIAPFILSLLNLPIPPEMRK